MNVYRRDRWGAGAEQAEIFGWAENQNIDVLSRFADIPNNPDMQPVSLAIVEYEPKKTFREVVFETSPM